MSQTGTPSFRLRNGDHIPMIGLGTFGSDRYPAEAVSQAVAGAIRAGYRLIDCAAVYGNEAEIGRVLADAIREGAVQRQELFVISKLWNNKHKEADVLPSCQKTLKDLGLSQVDAYFVHWPFPNYHAPGVSVDSRDADSKPFSVSRFMATWRQMEKLHDLGLARHLGMSNMTVAKLEKVLPLCRVQPSLLEMELHPSFQQPALFEYAVSRGIQPIGYSPLGSPSRPERDRTPEDLADFELPVIRDIAQRRGIHPAQVCLKWAVQRGQVPIPFSVKEAQYRDNLRAVSEDPLTGEEMARIAALDQNNRLIKGQVFLWPGATDWRALWDEDGRIADEQP